MFTAEHYVIHKTPRHLLKTSLYEGILILCSSKGKHVKQKHPGYFQKDLIMNVYILNVI